MAARRCFSGNATFIRCALITAVVFLQIFLIICSPASAQNQSPNDQARLKALKNQLELYKVARERHEHDEFFRNSREAAVDIESSGLNWLSDYTKNSAVSDLFDVGESGVSVVAKQRMAEKMGVDSMSPERAERAKRLIDQSVDGRYTRPVKILGNIYKDGKLISEIKDQLEKGTLHGDNLDTAIVAMQTFKEGFPQALGGLSMIPGGSVQNKGIEVANTAMEIVGGTLLSGLYLVKAADTKNDVEKSEIRSKALKEIVGVTSKSLVAVGGSGMAELAAEAKLAYIDADVVSRLTYWAGAQYSAHSLRAEADKVRGDAITLLNQKINDTQHQIDLLNTRDDPALLQFMEGVGIDGNGAKRKLGEPGGIKLNTAAADQIAAKLDIDSVDYDPASGKVVLAGHTSKYEFDLDIFQTVLRLAAEVSEPFFGLYPANYPEWDSAPTWLSKQIYSKYGRDGYATLASRLTSVGIHLPMAGGRNCYAADLRLLDPALYGEMDEKFDLREERVYSPTWLRYTHVGEILYQADTNIKAILTGVRRNDDTLQLADVWKIPGFLPATFYEHKSSAGRLNLELDASNVPASASHVELSEVRPKLQYYPRKPGTDQDLPRTEDEQQVVDLFDNHWQEFVSGVEPFAQLMNVYRAYVAARYLVAKNPGLAKQIADFGEPGDAKSLPAYHVGESSVTGCVAGGRLEPLRPDGKGYFQIGGGASGGTAFKLSEKINYISGASKDHGDGLLNAALGSQEGIFEQGDRTALAIGFDDRNYPLSDQRKFLIFLLGTTAIIGGVLLGLMRRFGKKMNADHICPHCAVIHRRVEMLGFFCDIAAIGSVLFLLGILFAAAVYSETPSATQFFVMIGSTACFVGILGVLGYLAHVAVAMVNRARQPMLTPTRHLAAGARILGVLLVVVLFSGGLSERALAQKTMLLSGGYGQLILRVIGETTVIREALIILTLSIIVSALLRWALPFMLHSNPLPLGLKSHLKGSGG